MPNIITQDLDFLTARLHGRRSRMAESERLESLCRIRNMPELGRAVFPDGDTPRAAHFQQRLTREFVAELTSLLPYLAGPRARWVSWMATRAAITVPTEPTPWDVFADTLPRGPLRESAHSSTAYPAKPFFMEAVLNRAYFIEWAVRTSRLPAADQAAVTPLVNDEIATFNAYLESRGRSVYGLSDEIAARLRVPNASGKGRKSSVAATTEAAAWTRFRHLANRAMRGSPTGLGTVAGYTALRRVEITNLTTLSEGIRLGMPEEAIRARMITGEVHHV